MITKMLIDVFLFLSYLEYNSRHDFIPVDVGILRLVTFSVSVCCGITVQSRLGSLYYNKQWIFLVDPAQLFYFVGSFKYYIGISQRVHIHPVVYKTSQMCAFMCLLHLILDYLHLYILEHAMLASVQIVKNGNKYHNCIHNKSR